MVFNLKWMKTLQLYKGWEKIMIKKITSIPSGFEKKMINNRKNLELSIIIQTYPYHSLGRRPNKVYRPTTCYTAKIHETCGLDNPL